ncbi:MAG: sulfite exporter TauE/SafE family protein [Spirochaetia bacterium]|nr:sulfite exporter TauE/SafE family protein [Spirochaetia bacterium]
MIFQAVYIESFLLGFIGSLHCAGMCGPFVHILNSRSAPKWKINLAYNLSRTLVYTTAGFILGGLGETVDKYFINNLAIFSGGAILILFSLAYLLSGKRKKASEDMSFFFIKLSSFMKKNRNIYALAFMMGLSAAFMPCGLLYGAYGLTLTAESAVYGAFTMLFFSLGMYPALFAIGFASNYFMKKIPADGIRIILGIFMLILGLSTILWRLYLIQTNQCH